MLMLKSVNHVVILGGGTAGWLTASLIAAEHGDAVSVTVVESPDIPIIGVGEGTWPSMRTTLQKIGIHERDLIRHCDASFKQGTEFIDWVSEREPNRYYHPFSLPADYATLNLAEHWLASELQQDFCSAVTPQAEIIRSSLAPKSLDVPEYAFQLNYGYHFDAAKLSELLSEHALQKLGVFHIFANLQEVVLAENGAIEALKLDRGDLLSADIYVDCSGQRSLLLGEALGVPALSMAEILPNDRAIATQVPYAYPEEEIASATRSSAQSCGWIWDIGLQSRRGVGYVHSSVYISEDEAHEVLSSYLKATQEQVKLADLTFRSIPFTPERREVAWFRNCVAIGLSAGFIEPLEASSIALIEQAASRLCALLPICAGSLEREAQRFNEQMTRQWRQVEEFLQLHYALSQRDSDYWRDVRASEGLLPSLKEKLESWDRHPVWHEDAPRYDELFPSASYQYVLYGMAGRYLRPSTHRHSFQKQRPQADKALHEVRQKTRNLMSLPGNRALLNALRTDEARLPRESMR